MSFQDFRRIRIGYAEWRDILVMTENNVRDQVKKQSNGSCSKDDLHGELPQGELRYFKCWITQGR